MENLECQPKVVGQQSFTCDVESGDYTSSHARNDNDDDEDSKHAPATEGSHSALTGESGGVIILRIALIIILLVAAVVVSTEAFFYTSNAEEELFRRQYTNFAAKLSDAFRVNLEQSLFMADWFSISYTSYAANRNLIWPFVTLPDFEMKAARARHMIQNKARALLFAPIVSDADKENWELYSTQNNDWVEEGIDYRKNHWQFYSPEYQDYTQRSGSVNTPPLIWGFDANNTPRVETSPGPWLPVWQYAPAQYNPFQVNFNTLSLAAATESLQTVLQTQDAVLSSYSTIGADLTSNTNTPLSSLIYPVFDSVHDKKPRKVVGILGLVIYWEYFLQGVLPENANTIVAVLSNTCGQAYTYEITGENVKFVGDGDLHESTFDEMEVAIDFLAIQVPGLARVNDLGCRHMLRLYPSSSFYNSYMTNKPKIYTAVAAAIFAFTSLLFLAYDWLVKRRLDLVKRVAVRSNEIVASLFPSLVRDRLFRIAESRRADGTTTKRSYITSVEQHSRRFGASLPGVEAQTSRLKTFLQKQSSEDATPSGALEQQTFGSDPIAFLFPNTTVFFADIAGFTAWCSQRQPTQVFVLLETIYRAFDALAKRHGVFKVETIGDCYMAVTGLPDPQDDHAVVMARFARACVKKMQMLAKKLEATLGPGTAELSIRVGLHSGSVTAGVLRGDKARFQLFGDTVNTASRMESNGQRNRVHISEETAQLLEEAGKRSWITPREDRIVAKGKGDLQTYWLITGERTPDNVNHNNDSCDNHANIYQDQPASASGACIPRDYWTTSETSLAGTRTMPRIVGQTLDPDRRARLVDWNVDVLLDRLKAVVAIRRDGTHSSHDWTFNALKSTPREEIVEVIVLHKFDDTAASLRKTNPENVKLGSEVILQLKNYVARIASMYRDNPFHNFEHASHVTMSCNTLLQRMMLHPPMDYKHDDCNWGRQPGALSCELHDRTFGIASDPLTQFAMVFAALIHDVDHPGISNAHLVQQGQPIAIRYNNKSVAEQNSIDVAWSLLMADEFVDLRKCIFASKSEYDHFRQVVVNSVMATDLFDAELCKGRRDRWEKAFRVTAECASDDKFQGDELESIGCKATAVIELVIQASDVSHTMQHWDVYRKWNERLFREMDNCFKADPASNDPSLNWYDCDLTFFDTYVVPLAGKLKTSGVFGASGDEYLKYAHDNRKKWALDGKVCLQQMLSRCREVVDRLTEIDP